MSESVSIALPFPPSTNNLFSQTRTGRRFPSRKYQAWRKEADWSIVSQGAKVRVKIALLQRKLIFPLHVHIELVPRDKRAFDPDNFQKAPIDALVRMGVLPDDNHQYVGKITTTVLSPDKAKSGATVTITSAGAGGPRLSDAELISGV